MRQDLFLGPAWPDAEYLVDGGSPLGSPTAMRRSVGTIRPVAHVPFAFALLLAIPALVCGCCSSVSAQGFSWGEATPYLVFSTYLGGSTPCMDCSDVRTFAQNAASDAWGNTYVTGATTVSDLAASTCQGLPRTAGCRPSS